MPVQKEPTTLENQVGHDEYGNYVEVIDGIKYTVTPFYAPGEDEEL